MAITKERLEELIKQKAKIWGIGKHNNVFCVGLRFYKGSLNNTEWYNNKLETYSKFFETKEDAEFALKYQNIPRTETLSLPTWEEFCKGKSIYFKTKNIEYRLYVFTKNKKTNNCRIMISADKGSDDWFVFEKPLTQENYLEACRICKKLFLGEEI